MDNKVRRKLASLIPKLFFKNRPLAIQIFALSAVLVIVPMLAVGLISYRQSSNVLKDEASQYNLEVLEQVRSHVEYYIRDFELTAIKLLNHPDMIAFLMNKTREEADAGRSVAAMENLLAKAAFSSAEVADITLVVDNIGSISVANAFPPYPVDIRREYWYHALPDSGEPIFVSRLIRWPDREERVLSLIKRVHSPQTLEPIGLLIIDISFRRLQEIALVFGATERSLYILDAGGHYVYHPVRTLIGRPAEAEVIAASRNTEMEILDSGDKRKGFFTVDKSHQLNWYFLVSVPYEKITRGRADIGQAILAAIILTLVFAYLLGLAYLTTVIRPLRRMHALMRQVEVGNLTGSLPVESQDEIGDLSLGFNKMVARLSALVEEVYASQLREAQALLGQRETEMKALQAQVNPHFIGNSLETIRGMALERGSKDIGLMAGWLGLLLRYNLRQGSPSVDFGEEIKYLDIYLKIQGYRFGDIVGFRLDVPDWALTQKIAKFSLQPLVENCFTHGMSGKQGKMQIVVAVEADGDDAFFVKVHDTGRGISPQRLAEIRASLAAADADGAGHIGIANVHRRTVSLFGAGYGVQINSSPGGGTTLSIRLPRTYVGEGDDTV